MGVEWEHTHLNGELLYIKEDKIIKDNMKKIIYNYGMPINTNKFGDLIILGSM